MPRNRRIGLQHGRGMAARRQAQTQASGVQHEHGGGRSQGPAHGQGLGLGLYLLTTGGVPGQQGGGGLPAAPAFKASTSNAYNGGTGSYTITLPTYSVGDTVIIVLSLVMGNGDNSASAAGWTQIVTKGMSATAPLDVLRVFQRTMTGSEGASVVVTFSGSIASITHVIGAAASYSGGSTREASMPTNSSGASGETTWSVGPLTTTGVSRRIITVQGANQGGTATAVNGTVRVAASSAGHNSVMIADTLAPSVGDYSNNGTTGANTFWAAAEIGLSA